MRKQTVLLIALTVLAIGMPALTQEVPKKEEGKKAIAEKKALTGRIDKLVSELGAEDFALREKAYKELKSRGEAARPHLGKALESKDPEVRWRVSRLLGLLDEKAATKEKGDRKPEGLEPFGRFSPGDLSDRLNGVFGELFENIEPFQFRFYHDGIPGGDRFDIDKMLRQFRRETGKLTIKIDGCISSYNFQRSDGKTKTGFSIAIAGDGSVKAVLTRKDAEGAEKITEYVADSLEAFKKKFPAVVKEFDLDGFSVSVEWPDAGGRFFSGRGLGLRMKRAPFGFARKFQPRILGVYTEEPGAALRAQLGLGENEGLVVTEVAGSTFAEKVGVRRMDILLSINGKTVSDANRIREVMGGVKEGELMTLLIIRAGEREKLEGGYFNRK
jgi:hypothetical protein